MKNIAFGSVNFGRGTRTALATIFAAAMVGCGGNRQRATEERIPVFAVAAAIDGDALLTVNDIAESVEFVPLAAAAGRIEGVEEDDNPVIVIAKLKK